MVEGLPNDEWEETILVIRTIQPITSYSAQFYGGDVNHTEA